MNQNDEFKVIFLGNSSVGKSSIIIRLLNNKFSNNIPVTLGASFLCKSYDKEKINLNVWDTCGQERYKGINTLYYRDSDVIIFVIDCLNDDSYLGFETYYEDIKNKGPKNPLLILFFNKYDLVKENNKDKIDIYIKEIKEKYLNIKIIEKVSACTGYNIPESFNLIIENLKDKNVLLNNNVQSLIVDKFNSNKKNKNKNCC